MMSSLSSEVLVIHFSVINLIVYYCLVFIVSFSVGFLCFRLKHTTQDLKKMEAKYKELFQNKTGNGIYEVVGCFQKRTAWSKHQCLIVFDSIDGTILGRCVRFVNVDSYISKTGKRIDFDEVKDSKEIQIIGNQLFVLE